MYKYAPRKITIPIWTVRYVPNICQYKWYMSFISYRWQIHGFYNTVSYEFQNCGTCLFTNNSHVIRMSSLVLYNSIIKYIYIYMYSPTRYTMRFHWLSFYWALRLQLYMFRTSWVHLQELLCSYCICSLWHVVIRVLPGTSSWYKVVGYTDLTMSS